MIIAKILELCVGIFGATACALLGHKLFIDKDSALYHDAYYLLVDNVSAKGVLIFAAISGIILGLIRYRDHLRDPRRSNQF